MSVDTFNSKNDVFVAIAQPSMENCMVLEWDHIEMNFRSYDNITGMLWKETSPVTIKGRTDALAWGEAGTTFQPTGMVPIRFPPSGPRLEITELHVVISHWWSDPFGKEEGDFMRKVKSFFL